MKVLWVTGSFFPANTGGTDTVMYWIAKTLVKEKVNLTITTPSTGINGKIPTNCWHQTDYGRIIYVPTSIHYFPLRLIRKAYRQLQDHRNIHLCNIFYPSSIAVATIGVLLNKKIFWSVHGELDPWARSHHSYKKKPFLWFIRTFLKNKVIFHATCEDEIKYIRQAIGRSAKVALVPNYILLPKRIEKPVQKSFLFVGRIHPKKGVEFLINGLAQSKLFRTSDFILRIVGDCNNKYGRQLQQLTRTLQLEDKVEFLGYKEGKEKHELFAGSYFTFMPSFTENFGMVVVESLAQGTPVVASRGTPWEILETRKAGFWTDNEAGSIGHAIDQIIKMPIDIYTAYRKRAYELVRDQYDIEKNIARWIDTYQNVFSA